MTNDAIGLIVFITLTTMLAVMAIFIVVRLFKFSPLYSATLYALAYGALIGGLAFVWLASTINVSVVPWIIVTLGLVFFLFGLQTLKDAQKAANLR